jgi:tyrosinase
MKQLTRRSILAGGAAASTLNAIPFSIWIKQQAWAAPFVRYNAASPEGQAMLQIYRIGVDRMMNMTPEQNPLSWTFQWYTHSVKEPPGRDSELNRIYPQPNAPFRALAQQMWNTCQAHHGENEDFFLPWHRMFVFYFEQIVRQVSDEPSFTLPYWNYSNPEQSALPPEFLDNTSPLFRLNRNPDPNNGNKIPHDIVRLDDADSPLNRITYSRAGADEGFCQKLDYGIHGGVHVWVGNAQGMGRVPWAGSDPIFWLHHCNIDRLWASWNRGECFNPTYPAWLNQQFVFADTGGNQVVATVADFRDIALLNYTYQEFEPVPATCHLVEIIVQTILAALRQLIRFPIWNEDYGYSARNRGIIKLDLPVLVSAVPPNQAIYLVFRNIRATSPPGVLYDVYLDLPRDETPSRESPSYVGTLNFFGVTMMQDMRHDDRREARRHEMAKMPPRDVSFEVTDKLKSLRPEGGLSPKPSVTIVAVPQGEPNETAVALIDEIQLVAQSVN